MRKIIPVLIALLLAFPAHADSPLIIGLNGNLTAYDRPWSTTPELVEAIRGSGLLLIRYPAGMVGNYWDPATGWIDQGVSEEDFISPWLYELQDDDKAYTLDDLAFYRAETGGQTVFMLNMLTQGLEDNLAMLREAESRGIPVNRVELGNEFYFERFDLAVSRFPTAESYAAEANVWAAAIKAEWPDSQVVAIGNAEHADGLPERESTWNERVIPALSSDVNAITLHIYPRPDQAAGETYAAILARSELGEYAGDVWVTEFNVSDYVGNVKNTELHGQLVTQWLEAFDEDERVRLVLLHNITSYDNDGDRWIAFYPSGELSPAGQALVDWRLRGNYLPLLVSE